METVENSIDPVVQALSTDGEIDFADLVRKTDQDVAAKVKVLRAGGSVDPERWIKRAAHLLHQKNFADALFCFKKANDPRGIAHSQAWLHEQEGRSRRAVNDFEGSITSYEQAIALFLELELFSDAADCYQAVGRYDKAAGMSSVNQICKQLNTNSTDRNLEEAWADSQSSSVLRERRSFPGSLRLFPFQWRIRAGNRGLAPRRGI